MEKLIFALCAAAFSGFATAQDITLVCKGWEPFYKRFQDGALNQGAANDTFVVRLDTKKKAATFRSQIGEITTDLLVQEEWYSGSAPVRAEALGRYITHVNLSVNRMTGKTIISYNFTDKTGNVIFDGTCAPGKPLF